MKIRPPRSDSFNDAELREEARHVSRTHAYKHIAAARAADFLPAATP